MHAVRPRAMLQLFEGACTTWAGVCPASGTLGLGEKESTARQHGLLHPPPEPRRNGGPTHPFIEQASSALRTLCRGRKARGSGVETPIPDRSVRGVPMMEQGCPGPKRASVSTGPIFESTEDFSRYTQGRKMTVPEQELHEEGEMRESSPFQEGQEGQRGRRELGGARQEKRTELKRGQTR